jgi:thioredoxin reductase
MYKLVDAESYSGRRILVVGGGDSAVEATLGLARGHGNEVTLSYRRERLVRIKKENEERFSRLSAERRVRVSMPSEVEAIAARSVRLRGPNGSSEIPNDYVFVFAGGEPPFALLRQAGVRFGVDPTPAHQGP